MPDEGRDRCGHPKVGDESAEARGGGPIEELTLSEFISRWLRAPGTDLAPAQARDGFPDHR